MGSLGRRRFGRTGMSRGKWRSLRCAMRRGAGWRRVGRFLMKLVEISRSKRAGRARPLQNREGDGTGYFFDCGGGGGGMRDCGGAFAAVGGCFFGGEESEVWDGYQFAEQRRDSFGDLLSEGFVEGETLRGGKPVDEGVLRA